MLSMLNLCEAIVCSEPSFTAAAAAQLLRDTQGIQSCLRVVFCPLRLVEAPRARLYVDF